MNATDPLDVHRAAIRAAGFIVTPWRLGVEVGKAFAFTPRDEPASPYANPISHRQFTQGVRDGVARARHARIASRRAP
jgi:hypothetical protein